MITGSKELIRDINQTLVLETIINKGPISRADISKEIGLTKATISAIVTDLLQKELILEIGSGNTKYGRKPILISFNEDAGYVISIDVGVEHIVAICSNLLGKGSIVNTVDTPKTKEGIKEALVKIIDNILDKDYNTAYGLVGIALGIHGVVEDNKVTFAPYYDLTESDLGDYLEKKFNTRVYCENEANLSVLGEHIFIKDFKNIANISIHSGVGLGLIIDGDLYTGYSGYAGEIGHTIIDVDGRPCPCGNKGCLEQYVSEQALLKEFKERKNLDNLDFKTLASMYQDRDEDAIAMFDKFTKFMTVCINNTLNSYNPDIVIINSSFTHYFPEITKKIEASLNSRLNSVLHIYPSKLQGKSILIGGVSVVVKDFLGVRNINFEYDEIFKK